LKIVQKDGEPEDKKEPATDLTLPINVATMATLETGGTIMQTVGVRELKNRLTYYLGQIKSGENVVVTDRGKPIAILHRLDKLEDEAGLDERLAILAAQGLLTLPNVKVPAAPFTPVRVDGEPVSETLIRDRR